MDFERFFSQRRMGVKRSISIILVVLMALTISTNQPAWAAIITVEVEGVVNSIGTQGAFGLDGSVIIGSDVTGYCTYDTDTPDLDSSGNNGRYALISISMTIGNYTFAHDPMSSEPALFRVFTVDPGYSAGSSSPRFDGIIYVDSVPNTYDDITWGYTSFGLMSLSTSSSEYIPTDALPDLDSWPDLAVFDVGRDFGVRFFDLADGYFEMSGEVTSLTVVPEPATVLLLALGGLALLRKRREN